MGIIGSHHIALRALDVEAMKQFYTHVLGFPVRGEIAGRGIEFIDIGGTTIELMAAAEDASAAPDHTRGFVHLAWEVDDLDATVAELQAKGIELSVGGISDIRNAFFSDPDGNRLELFQSPSLSWAGR